MQAWQAATLVVASLSGALSLLWHQHQIKHSTTQESQKQQVRQKTAITLLPRSLLIISLLGALQVTAHRNNNSHKQRRSQGAHPRSETAVIGSTSSNNNSAADGTSIPAHERKALQAFLRRVYGWRGWQGGPYHITQAWHAVEAAAASPAGGGWQQQFTGQQLTDANCDALLRLIDAEFCGSKLIKRLNSSNKAGSGGGGGGDGVSTRLTKTKSAAAIAEDEAAAGAADAAAAASSSSSSDQQAGHAKDVPCCSGGGGGGLQAASEPSSNLGSSSRLETATGYQAADMHGVPTVGVAAGSSSCEVASCEDAAAAGRREANSCTSTTQASQSNSAMAAGKLCCRVVQNFADAWLAYFDTQDNVIYINCWRWAKAVSAAAPLNCEGVVCVNRLQLLMHTLAHELVHAVVFHLFPEIDSSSPAYTVNSRHGPIFHLLNKQLFGHSSDALQHVQLLSAC